VRLFFHAVQEIFLLPLAYFSKVRYHRRVWRRISAFFDHTRIVKETVPMRMRRKPWARPELAACPFSVDHPTEWRGQWAQHFARPDQPMDLELGCGKGGFISVMASQHPERNFIAVDIKSEVLVLAKRKAEAEFAAVGRDVDNLFIMSQEIECICDMLAPEERIERIFINFCNPCPKKRSWKHRLTHTRQLEKYKTFLVSEGDLYFKTDDDMLFDATLEYLAEAGFTVVEMTRDLPLDHPADAIITEHERMFRDLGITIKYLHAVAPKK
jgi:tRNA (guanine-N7-)-methyltransferase